MPTENPNLVDRLTKWLEKIKEFAQDPGKNVRNFIFEFLFKKWGETKEKAEKIRETAQEERMDIFGEVSESILNRYFPNISKLLDLQSNLTGKTDIEVISWQNEFEALTALTLFIPDFLLKFITGPLVKSKFFMKIVENWPLCGEKMVKKIKKNKDPDDVINMLRIMYQDMIAGKVSSQKILEWTK